MSKELEYWNSVLPERIADEACPIDILEHCLSKIEPYIFGDRIFDLGCGPGRIIGPLAERNPDTQYHGIDFSQKMLSIAPKAQNIFYHLNDGSALPCKPNVFTSGYSMLMFQHVTADVFADYLKEVYRVLIPGGKFRFQFVVGDEDVFLARNVSKNDVINWLTFAGLQYGGFATDEKYPTWLWITASKPL